ncbi:hypothetical protein ACWGM0_10805 [Sphingomonas bisphenolicum]
MTDKTTPAQDLRSALEDALSIADLLSGDVPLTSAAHKKLARARAALAQPAENAKGGEVVAIPPIVEWIIELSRRDIMREQTDFIGRMHQAMGEFESICYDHPDGDLDEAERDDAGEALAGLAGLALAQLAMVSSPADPLSQLAHPPATQPIGDAAGMREAVERFIADVDDGDRADAGTNPLMLAHIEDFRTAIRALPLPAAEEKAAGAGEVDPDFREYVRKAGERLAPHSADASGTPTRDALVWINAALHPQARASVPLDAPIAPNIPAALKPADATPAGEEQMRRTLEFIRDTDASARFLREAAKTTLAALSTPPALDEGDAK